FVAPVHPPPISPLFPYTTLFRSYNCQVSFFISEHLAHFPCSFGNICPFQVNARMSKIARFNTHFPRVIKMLRNTNNFYFFHRLRSEEHTSELQSRENLVCRLLLE